MKIEDLEGAIKGNNSLKRALQYIEKWGSALEKRLGVEAIPQASIANEGVGVLPPPLCPFTVSGASGRFIITINVPDSVKGPVVHQIKTSSSVPFSNSTDVITYPDNPATMIEIYEGDVTKFIQLRSRYYTSDYNKPQVNSGTVVWSNPCGPCGDTPSPLRIISACPSAQPIYGELYSYTFVAVGGKNPRTWSATGLPAGLTINPSTGTVSGIPTASGTFHYTVTVTDSSSGTPLTTSVSCTFVIAGVAPSTCVPAVLDVDYQPGGIFRGQSCLGATQLIVWGFQHDGDPTYNVISRKIYVYNRSDLSLDYSIDLGASSPIPFEIFEDADYIYTVSYSQSSAPRKYRITRYLKSDHGVTNSYIEHSDTDITLVGGPTGTIYDGKYYRWVGHLTFSGGPDNKSYLSRVDLSTFAAIDLGASLTLPDPTTFINRMYAVADANYVYVGMYQAPNCELLRFDRATLGFIDSIIVDSNPANQYTPDYVFLHGGSLFLMRRKNLFSPEWVSEIDIATYTLITTHDTVAWPAGQRLDSGVHGMDTDSIYLYGMLSSLSGSQPAVSLYRMPFSALETDRDTQGTAVLATDSGDSYYSNISMHTDGEETFIIEQSQQDSDPVLSTGRIRKLCGFTPD